jgi:hypothetical protein
MCQEFCVNEEYQHHFPDEKVVDPVYVKIEEGELTTP